MTSKTADAVHFFRAWLSEPLRVAAVIPSGRALSALMVSEVSPEMGPVIELGPGTGAFTRALIAKGITEENLALIEYGSDFAAKLNLYFPRAKIFRMDAAKLHDVVLFNGVRAGAVISGLPLLSMPPRKVLSILDGAFAHLRADGAFYQFTYGPRCPISRSLLDRLGLKANFIGHTFANIPPAAVYRIRHRKPRRTPAQRLLQLPLSPDGQQPWPWDRRSNDR
ncbi:phospholipid methyltransferase [Rhizobium sophorae]|uniref:Phospholipid methyltransferase n=1 Tax=Rhizobium sophorae TaxID=1535242 RepID=A0A7Y3S4V7_9HYPH|nr:phospholipid methyltransferase [Rhizobium sophorae]NNU36032.1 phospholipid methyltransferase [Rhizobium sophorae]